MKNQNKICFVPGCRNTSINTPNKKFVCVPKPYSRKVEWFKAVKRDFPKSKSVFFCCEDHFDFEQDMENYIRYKLMGGNVILKPDVVPHIYNYQPDREQITCASLTEERKHVVKEALLWNLKIQEQKANTTFAAPVINFNQPSTSNSNCTTKSVWQLIKPVSTLNIMKINVLHDNVQVKSIDTQEKPLFLNKHVMCKMKISVRHITSLPKKSLRILDKPCLPFKNICNTKKILFNQASISSEIKETEFNALISKTTSKNNFKELKLLENKQKNKILNVPYDSITKKPKGIPNQWFPDLVDLISSKYSLKRNNILLTLMKIKLNDSFSQLGKAFSMSTDDASKIFRNTIIDMKTLLNPLIYWPEKDKIQNVLPIPFQGRYNNVQSIIECLEIQIQKPSDPIKQSLTWSEYRKCNTLKYLISFTPGGFINFVSKGYGGRISDSLLIEISGYLEMLPIGCDVMTNKTLKGFAKLLNERNCQLIKLPSGCCLEKSIKSEILESNPAVSLRIHIEKVICRLQEFQYLNSHSVINYNLISQTDNIIVVACALINLQT